MTSMKVAVRVRPLNDREILVGSKVVVDVIDNNIVVTDSKNSEQHDCDHRSRIHKFTFDYCFSSVDKTSEKFASQVTVYEDFGKVVLQALLEGYNSCVIAYGQSGSGKTYTMMGTKEEEGLTPRICQGLLNKLTEETVSFRMDISYMEIYNEHVYDLLNKNETKNNKKSHLRIREHPVHGPYVEGLSIHMVNDISDIFQLLSIGNDNRTKAATHVHDRSSRSHAIFTVHCSQACLDESQPKETMSKLHMVDLAGSEKAGPEFCHSRIKEGANINKSLVTLGNVISILVELSQRSKNGINIGARLPFVPYRDSHLTWLLKDSLGGNSHTFMLAVTSPAQESHLETISTLRYAQRAKSVLNCPVINEDPGTKIICDLRLEITKLKDLLANAELINKRTFITPLPNISQLNIFMKESEARVDQLTKSWFEKWLQTYKIVLKKFKNNIKTSNDKYENEGIPAEFKLKIEGQESNISLATTITSAASAPPSALQVSTNEKKENLLNPTTLLDKKCLNINNQAVDLMSIDFDMSQKTFYSSVSSECVILPNEIIYYTKKKLIQDNQNSSKMLACLNYINSHPGTENLDSKSYIHDSRKFQSQSKLYPSADNVREISNFPPFRTPLSVSMSNIQYPFYSNYKTKYSNSVPLNIHINSCEMQNKSREMSPKNYLPAKLENFSKNNSRSSFVAIPLEKSQATEFQINNTFAYFSKCKDTNFTENCIFHHTENNEYTVPQRSENSCKNLCDSCDRHAENQIESMAIADIGSQKLLPLQNIEKHFKDCNENEQHANNYCQVYSRDHNKEPSDYICPLGETVNQFYSEEIQFDDHVAEESNNFMKLLCVLNQDSADTLNDESPSRRGSDIWSLLSLSSNDCTFHESLEDFSLNDDYYAVSPSKKLNDKGGKKCSVVMENHEYCDRAQKCDYGTFSNDSSQSNSTYEAPSLTASELGPLECLNETTKEQSLLENNNIEPNEIYRQHNEICISSINNPKNNTFFRSFFSSDEAKPPTDICIKESEKLIQPEENFYNQTTENESKSVNPQKFSNSKSYSADGSPLPLTNLNSYIEPVKECKTLSASWVKMSSLSQECILAMKNEFIDLNSSPHKITDYENKCAFKSDQLINVTQMEEPFNTLQTPHNGERNFQLKSHKSDLFPSKIKAESSNSFETEKSVSWKLFSQNAPTLINTIQFEELHCDEEHNDSSLIIKRSNKCKALLPDELQNFIDGSEITDATEFVVALLNNELMQSLKNSVSDNDNFHKLHKTESPEDLEVHCNNSPISNSQNLIVVESFQNINASKINEQSQMQSKHIYTTNLTTTDLKESCALQHKPKSEENNKIFKKVPTLSEICLQISQHNALNNEKNCEYLRETKINSYTPCINTNTPKYYVRENEAQCFQHINEFYHNVHQTNNITKKLSQSYIIGHDDINNKHAEENLRKKLVDSTKENSTVLSTSFNNMCYDFAASDLGYLDSHDKTSFNCNNVGFTQEPDLATIDEEDKSTTESSGSSKISLHNSQTLKEEKDLLWTSGLTHNVTTHNENVFKNLDNSCEIYNKCNFMHDEMNDNDMKKIPKICFEPLNVKNFQNHHNSVSTSSSSDSITYVFVGKEHKDNVDFDTLGSLYSSKLGSVSLDSLEKASSQQHQLACISPRTLSIDSLIAEELLYQLRNGDNLAVPVNNRHQVKNLNQKNNNTSSFHQEPPHYRINSSSNIVPFKNNLSIIPYHHLIPTPNDKDNNIHQPDQGNSLQDDFHKCLEPCTIASAKCLKNQVNKTSKASNYYSAILEKHISSPMSDYSVPVSKSFPLCAKGNDLEIMKKGKTFNGESQETLFTLDHYLANETTESISPSTHYSWNETKHFQENQDLYTHDTVITENHLQGDNSTLVKELTKENLKLFEMELEENHMPTFLLPPPPLFDGSRKGDEDGNEDKLAISSPNLNPVYNFQPEIKTASSRGTQTENINHQCNSTDTSSSEIILRMMELLTDIIKILKAEPLPPHNTKCIRKHVKRKIHHSPNYVSRFSHKSMHKKPKDSGVAVNIPCEQQICKNLKLSLTPFEAEKSNICHSCYQSLERVKLPFGTSKELPEDYNFNESFDKTIFSIQNQKQKNLETPNYPQLPLQKPLHECEMPANFCSEYQQIRQPLNVTNSKNNGFLEQKNNLHPRTSNENVTLMNSKLEFQSYPPNLPSTSKLPNITTKISELDDTGWDTIRKKEYNPKKHLKHLIEVRRKVIASTCPTKNEVSTNTAFNEQQHDHFRRKVIASTCPTKNEVSTNTVFNEQQHDHFKDVETICTKENFDIWDKSSTPITSPSSSSEGYLSSVSSRRFSKPFSEASSDSRGSNSPIELSLPFQNLSEFTVEPLDLDKQTDWDMATLLSTRWYHNSADSGAFFMDSPGTEKKCPLNDNLVLPELRNPVSSNLFEAQKTHNFKKSLLFSKDPGHQLIKNLSEHQNCHHRNTKAKIWDSDDSEDYLHIPIQKVCISKNSETESRNIFPQQEKLTKKSDYNNSYFVSGKEQLNHEDHEFLQSIEKHRQYLKQRIKKQRLLGTHSPSKKQQLLDLQESDHDTFLYDSYMSLPKSCQY